MPVLNDFGQAAYDRANAQITDLANRLGIQREVIVQYVNDKQHLPMSLAELENWGNTPDPIYGQRRRQPNGVWTPLQTGPTPGLTDAQRAGFPGHYITNEVGQLERFLNVDPNGNIWGGSWDANYNQAHPGGSPALPAATGPRTAAGTTFSAQSNPGNPYAPGGSTPDPALAATWDAANPAPGQAGTPTPTSSGGASTPAAGGGYGGGGYGVNPQQLDAANQAATLAYNYARLALDRDVAVWRDENEKHRIALEAARDAWNKSYQTSQLSGYMPSTVAGRGQAGMDAIQALRQNAQYQAADGATRQQMEAATLAQTYGIDTASAARAIAEMRQLTATTGQPSTPALLEQIVGKYAPGAPTLDREKEQNQTAIQALTLLSQLRGPENAFAYADTLANLPPSIRANIQASMGRLPFTAQNPAQRGVLGDVGVGMGTPPLGQAAALPMGPAYPGQAIGGMPAATGPRTAQAGQESWQQYLPAPRAAGVQPAGQMQPLAPGYTPPQMTLEQQDASYARWAAQKAQASARGEWVTQEFRAPPPGFAQRNPTFNPATYQIPADGGPAAQAALQAAMGAYQTTAGRALGTDPGTTLGPRTQPGLALPNQISPTDWNNTNVYARKLMLAGYEHEGQDKEAVMDAYNRSLPRAVGPRTGSYRAA